MIWIVRSEAPLFLTSAPVVGERGAVSPSQHCSPSAKMQTERPARRCRRQARTVSVATAALRRGIGATEEMFAGNEIGLLLRQAHGDDERIPRVRVVGDDEAGAVRRRDVVRQVEFSADRAVKQRIEKPPDAPVAFVNIHVSHIL